MGSHAGVDVSEGGPFGLNGNGHLDVEIADASGNWINFEPSIGGQVSRVSILSRGVRDHRWKTTITEVVERSPDRILVRYSGRNE